jgi:DNA topoisomerase IB
MIIDTYIDKINNPKHTNREELIQKLRKKFIKQYNIDTSAVFSGNRLYILMFDINSPQSISPTEPTHGTGTQIHADNIA